MSEFWKWFTGAWEYVGSFEGHVSHSDGGDPRICYFILRQLGKRRRVKTVNGLGNERSRHSVWAEAQVEAWLAGGPLPHGLNETRTVPERRPKAELIVFPGGRPSAEEPR